MEGIAKSQHLIDVLSTDGRFHLVDILVFCMFFNLGLGSLYMFANNEILALLVDMVDLLLILLLLFLFLKKMRGVRHPINVAVLLVLGVIIACCTKSIIFLKATMLLFALKDEPYVNVVQSARAGLVIAVLIGLATCFLGLDSEEQFRRNGMAFGFGHPNQAALFYSLIVMMGVVVGESGKRSKISLSFDVILIWLILETGSKTALIAIAASFVLFKVFHGDIFYSRTVECITMLTPVAIFVFAIVSAVFLYKIPALQWVNDFFTGRLWLNHFALSNFRITVFGQASDLHVSGVYNDLLGWGNITTTVDCAYISSLISYGVVGVGLMMLTIVVTLRKAWKSESSALMATTLVLCFYAFSESIVFSPYIFFPVLSIFANLEQKKVLK